MNNNMYTALTIGPIVETLLTARKTRELWAGSFMFSYIMRTIAEKLNANNDLEVLLPFIDNQNIGSQNCRGSGLYPDRIIVKHKNDAVSKEDIVEIAYNELTNNNTGFCKKVSDHLNAINYSRYITGNGLMKFNNPFSQRQVEDYILNYLHIYAVHTKLPHGSNIVFKLYELLDTAELRDRVLPIEEPVAPANNIFADWSPLRIFWHRVRGSFLMQDGFCDKDIRFPSLPQIASAELMRLNAANYLECECKNDLKDKKDCEQFTNEQNERAENEDKGEDNFIKDLKGKFRDNFMARHKYVAIVHADGDNVSKIIGHIGKVGNEPQLLNFSERMLKYAKDATEKIVKFGGAPVYMGGDDMLFFAPVTAPGKGDESKLKTILELVSELDTLFEQPEYFGELIEKLKKLNKVPPADKRIAIPTMSYGIAITYYKHPLYEGRRLSYSLMEHVKNKVKGKNAINLKLVKHSGQAIPVLFKKSDGQVWRIAMKIINYNVGNSDFLNGFTYKLSTFAVVIDHIADKPARLKEFFRNYFNENYRQQKTFFKKLTELILALSVKNSGSNKLTKQDFELIYGILRFVHFINADDKDF